MKLPGVLSQDLYWHTTRKFGTMFPTANQWVEFTFPPLLMHTRERGLLVHLCHPTKILKYRFCLFDCDDTLLRNTSNTRHERCRPTCMRALSHQHRSSLLSSLINWNLNQLRMVCWEHFSCKGANQSDKPLNCQYTACSKHHDKNTMAVFPIHSRFSSSYK